MFPAGEVLRNQAIEHNVAAFSELSFALRWQGMLSRGRLLLQITNLMSR